MIYLKLQYLTYFHEINKNKSLILWEQIFHAAGRHPVVQSELEILTEYFHKHSHPIIQQLSHGLSLATYRRATDNQVNKHKTHLHSHR